MSHQHHSDRETSPGTTHTYADASGRRRRVRVLKPKRKTPSNDDVDESSIEHDREGVTRARTRSSEIARFQSHLSERSNRASTETEAETRIVSQQTTHTSDNSTGTTRSRTRSATRAQQKQSDHIRTHDTPPPETREPPLPTTRSRTRSSSQTVVSNRSHSEASHSSKAKESSDDDVGMGSESEEESGSDDDDDAEEAEESSSDEEETGKDTDNEQDKTSHDKETEDRETEDKEMEDKDSDESSSEDDDVGSGIMEDVDSDSEEDGCKNEDSDDGQRHEDSDAEGGQRNEDIYEENGQRTEDRGEDQEGEQQESMPPDLLEFSCIVGANDGLKRKQQQSRQVHQQKQEYPRQIHGQQRYGQQQHGQQQEQDYHQQQQEQYYQQHQHCQQQEQYHHQQQQDDQQQEQDYHQQQHHGQQQEQYYQQQQDDQQQEQDYHQQQLQQHQQQQEDVDVFEFDPADAILSLSNQVRIKQERKIVIPRPFGIPHHQRIKPKKVVIERPGSIRKAKLRAEEISVPVGPKLLEFLNSHESIKDVCLCRGKRRIKEDLVTMVRDPSAVEKNTWNRGKKVNQRCRYDDHFVLTEKGQEMNNVPGIKGCKNPYVVSWYLWCSGQGNCKRKCGGYGECKHGKLILDSFVLQIIKYETLPLNKAF